MGNKISLRDVEESDLSIFFVNQLEPAAIRMADFPSKDKANFIEYWKKVLVNPSIIKKTVIFNGNVAGNIMCFEHSGKMFVGFWYGKAYWGRGIATNSLGIFIEIANYRPLYALVAPENVASIHVLEKCGFIKYESEGNRLIYQLPRSGND